MTPKSQFRLNLKKDRFIKRNVLESEIGKRQYLKGTSDQTIFTEKYSARERQKRRRQAAENRRGLQKLSELCKLSGSNFGQKEVIKKPKKNYRNLQKIFGKNKSGLKSQKPFVRMISMPGSFVSKIEEKVSRRSVMAPRKRIDSGRKMPGSKPAKKKNYFSTNARNILKPRSVPKLKLSIKNKPKNLKKERSCVMVYNKFKLGKNQKKVIPSINDHLEDPGSFKDSYQNEISVFGRKANISTTS